MRAIEFIVEGYKEANAEFIQLAPEPMVADTIARYRDLVNRNQVQGQERNIDYWRKQGWDQFRVFVDKKGSEASKTQVKRKKAVGNSIFLREDEQWLLVIPLDKNASCFYGKNSSWCTTKPEHSYFEQYFFRHDVILVYCLNKQTGGMFAIAGHPRLEGGLEIFDQQDNPMNEARFKQVTGLDPQQIIQEAITKYSPQITAAKGPYTATYAELKEIVRTIKQRDPEVEKKLLLVKDGVLINSYVANTMPDVLHGRTEMPADFPQALILPLIGYNPAILNSIPNQTEQQQFAAVDTIYGGQYVKNPSARVIDRALTRHGSNIKYFPVDYETMVKYPMAAAFWADEKKQRVPEAEEAILKEPRALYHYTKVPVGRPWPAAEQAILTMPNISPYTILYYAKNYIKGRWPEGEQELLRRTKENPDTAYVLYEYAKDIIGGRWPEAEPFIIVDPTIAAVYARRAMRRRWKEAEPAMLATDPKVTEDTSTIEEYFDFIDSDAYYREWSDHFSDRSNRWIRDY